MKRTVASCVILSAFMLVLTNMPHQLLHIDFVKSAYAYIANDQNYEWDIILGKGNDEDHGDRHENRGQGNDGEHGDLYSILDRGNDLITILDKDNKRDYRGQEYNEENILGRFDDWKKFRSKDDDCKDFQDHDKDWHKNWGKNEDWDTYWGNHKHYDSYDNWCDRRYCEHEDHHEHHHKRNNCNVPEPSMFSLLGAGIAGVGAYSFIRRRSSK